MTKLKAEDSVCVAVNVVISILRPESSWVCGVFILGGRSRPPKAQYFELPAQITDCPAKYSQWRKNGKFSKKCGRLAKEWEANWLQKESTEETWTPLVNILSSGKFARDVCTVAKQELGVENVPGDLDEPLELGYYYSYCGLNKWRDTGKRSDVTFCCQDGVSIDCDTRVANLEAEEAAAAAAEEAGASGPGSQSGGGSASQPGGQSGGQAGPGQSSSSSSSPSSTSGVAGPGNDIVAAPSDSGSGSGLLDSLQVTEKDLLSDSLNN